MKNDEEYTRKQHQITINMINHDMIEKPNLC